MRTCSKGKSLIARTAVVEYGPASLAPDLPFTPVS